MNTTQEVFKSFISNCQPCNNDYTHDQSIHDVINERALILKRADRECESHVSALKYYFSIK